MRFRTQLRASLVLLGLTVCAPRALAQDDWSLTRPRGGGDGSASESKPKKRPRPGQHPSRRGGGRSRDGAGSAAADPSERELARYRSRLANHPGDLAAFERLRGLWMRRDGTLEPAAERYREALEREPDDPASHAALAMLLAAQRKHADAEEHYRAARAQLPENPGLALAHARTLSSLDRTAEAKQALARAARPGAELDVRRDALRALARLEVEAGELAAARQHFAALARLEGGGAFAETEYARALSDAGLHAEAAEEYLALARVRRGDARAAGPLLRDAAREQLRAGEPHAADRHARKALQLARSDPALARELYELRVDAARQTGELQALAEELTGRAKGDPELLRLSASLWADLGETGRAEAAYRRVIARSPRDLDARLELAELLARAGQLERAVEQYQAMLRIAPRQPRFVVALAELLVQLGQAERARAVVAEASRRAPRDVGLHRELSELYLRWDMTDAAQHELELLTELAPRDPAPWIALGNLHMERGDTREAKQAWRHILELPGDDADAHATLAGVLADHDQLSAALEHIEAARRLRPSDLQLERDYASLLERASRLNEAEAAWSRVLRSEHADAVARDEARQHLIVLWKRSGTLGRRIVELEGRFRGPDAELEAGRTLAEALVRTGQGRLGDAAAVLETLVEADPGDIESLKALERVYERLGETERALALLERLATIDAARAQAYLRRAVEVALSAYEDGRAVELAERAVELDPARAEAHALLGDLYRRQQRPAAALEAYAEALQLDPTRCEVRMAVGEVQLGLGEVTAADEAFFEVLRDCRDEVLAESAARALFQIHSAQRSFAELEPRLLPLAVSRSDRPLYRRVLVDLYAAWLGPAARRRLADQQTQADRALLAATSQRAIRPLLEALAGEDPTQRETAVLLLGPLGNPNALTPLLALARGGADGRLRARALIAAALLGDPGALPVFEELARGGSRRLRPVATWAIARLGGSAPVGVLRELTGTADPEVRMFALLGLGHLRAGELAGEIARTAEHAERPEVRAAAIWALSALPEADARDVLLAGLGGPPEVARAALVGLADDPEALAAGLFAQTGALQRLALKLLTGTRPETPLETLPPPTFGGSPEAVLQEVARRATPEGKSLDLERAVDPLIAAFSTALAGGGAQARAALSLLSGRRDGLGLGPLRPDLSQLGTAECRRALASLQRLESGLSPALAELVRAGPEALREPAALLLAKTGSELRTPALEPLLTREHEPRGPTRRALLGALSQRGAPSGLRESLFQIAASDPLWVVRADAVRALGSAISGLEARRLERLLEEEPSALVRLEVVAVLARSSQPHVREILAQAGRDPEPRVAERARLALRARAPGAERDAEPEGPCVLPN